MENPIKMDDLGGPPLFLETPIYFQANKKSRIGRHWPGFYASCQAMVTCSPSWFDLASDEVDEKILPKKKLRFNAFGDSFFCGINEEQYFDHMKFHHKKSFAPQSLGGFDFW